ncbi:MAG: S41 family peptidase, partial [Planctomycetota bacterium]
DWEALRDRYLPLVDRVHDRDELNHLIYQLVGELEALHIRVSGGDSREAPNDVSIASLGARLVRDEEAGGYRVALRYKTDPEYPEELSPLARPEVDVHEGDVVVAINHMPTLSVTHPQALLRNQVGRQVLLEVKDGETGKQRKVVVQPISMSRESSLRYSHWEFTRRQRVEDRSDSNLGYLHLRAMGGRNYTEFVRNFYPVFRRQGLIIDVRHNRGGNIDSWILGRLMRKAWFFWQPRIGQPYWNMQYAFRGHMVVLCDEYTASDGEAFAEGFRRLGLGEVIGKRTWGGEIWLTSSNRLVDDGIATAAEFGVYGPDGIWLIEGHGVVPDIKVENLPHATFQGQDAQLDRAIDYLLQKIKEEPVEIPPHPAYPDKTPDQ